MCDAGKATGSNTVTVKTPTVRLELESRPESVTLVRGMLSGIAETLALEPELLDDLKTAVSEASNNVVIHAYEGNVGPLIVEFELEPDRIDVTVRDHGTGIHGVAPKRDRMAVGMAVMSALSDRTEFISLPEGGTEVRMSFDARIKARPGGGKDDMEEEWPSQLAGDVVVKLSSQELLAGVLGRMARAIAARAHFSVDRYSDLYPVTDAIADHARSAASSQGISFSIAGGRRRMELVIGKFRDGSSKQLRAEASHSSRLARLADEVTVEPDGDGEMLRVVVADKRRS